MKIKKNFEIKKIKWLMYFVNVKMDLEEIV